MPIKDWMTEEDVTRVFDALLGKARFVGGCVRDGLLNKPIKDIDIATSHIPEKTIELLKAKNIKVVPTGLKHGTVTAVIGNKNFEITTLRKDVECDGRHAEVEFTDSWEKDAARRDFTINAMSCTQKGELYDYFGGIDDLQNQVVCFVGDAHVRCEEDILRILRFFRFSAYYGSVPLDMNGLWACTKLANKISSLSAERIQAEMLKLLVAPKASKIVSEMKNISVLKKVLPLDIEIEKLVFAEKLEKKIGLAPNAFVRIAIMAEESDRRIEKLGTFWKLSGKDKQYLSSLVLNKFRFAIDDSVDNLIQIIRKTGKELFADLFFIKIAKTGGDITKLSSLYKKMAKKLDEIEIPQFPVTGKDIMELGVKSGPEVGKILQKAEIWWEEGDYTSSKSEILKFIKNKL